MWPSPKMIPKGLIVRTLSFPRLPASMKSKYTLLPQQQSDQEFSPVKARISYTVQRFRNAYAASRYLRWALVAAFTFFFFLVGHFTFGPRRPHVEQHWLNYKNIDGYFVGLRKIVPYSQYVPEWPYYNPYRKSPPKLPFIGRYPPTVPSPATPYPDYTSSAYLADHYPVQECFLDADQTRPAPNIFHYEGVVQLQPEPALGSHNLLGLREDVCWERWGRLGPYGYGYEESRGGSGVGIGTEDAGSEQVWEKLGGHIDYRGVDWSAAQKRCYENNKQRFHTEAKSDARSGNLNKHTLSRSAVVIRLWTGFEWTPYAILNFRAMINELSLKSGGEYDVHFLLHVKDEDLPIWASNDAYQQVVNDSVPEEFRGMVTLWSEKQVELVYTGDFGDSFESPSGQNPKGVYRGQHLPFQLFASKHQEYDFFWNWEVDIRYTGHFYELFNRLGAWSKEQSRDGLWERNAKHYIPQLHGTWEEFSNRVKTENADNEDAPILGPVDFPGSSIPNESIPEACPSSLPTAICGVGEDADLITLNPLFNPNDSEWVFHSDVTGYDTSLPIPPRRTALVAAGRYSKRLLNIMHEESYSAHHSMFVEMWGGSLALQYGLKAVYAPHPVYIDRAWPAEKIEQTFNGGLYGSSGGNSSSVFAPWNEHNFFGTNFYYNAGFARQLWTQWLGFKVPGRGGAERERKGSGRMCLRGMLLHPIKVEDGEA